MVDVVGLDRVAGVGEQVSVGGTGVNQAGGGEEVAAGRRFEFAPVVEGGSCERDVGGVFGLCEPDDAGTPVARSACMRNVKAFDGENVETALGSR